MFTIKDISINSIETYGFHLNNFGTNNISKCMLTLSPKQAYLNQNKLANIITWALNTFENLLVVFGIYNDRWNLLAKHQYESGLVLTKIKRETRKFERKLNNITDLYTIKDKIKFFDWEGVVSDASFVEIKNEVTSYKNREILFSNDLHNIVENYIIRSKPNFNENSFLFGISYMVEEISMFIYLYSLGYEIELYPGKDLQIMKKISGGGYPNFPYDLGHRTHISLQLHNNPQIIH